MAAPHHGCLRRQRTEFINTMDRVPSTRASLAYHILQTVENPIQTTYFIPPKMIIPYTIFLKNEIAATCLLLRVVHCTCQTEIAEEVLVPPKT